MEHWPHGADEIPARPIDPYMQHAPTAVMNGASPPKPFPDEVRKSRAEVLAIRRREREVGVPFRLKYTGMDARVRDLPFTDRIMLDGIPADMRVAVDKTIGIATNMNATQMSASALKVLSDISDLDDAYCIAGFIWPKLVRTEEERLEAIRTGRYGGEDDIFLVSDLDQREKLAYREFIMRDRGDGDEEDTARLASFPGSGMAQAANREDREGAR